nr:cysteine desulfhydrase [Marinomonas algarum]
MPYADGEASDQSHYVAMYRGDLENKEAPGNKWHKLRYHLLAAKAQKVSTIATFGGPFSNHLHAFAATLESLPLNGVAVVRGELQPSLTPTLRDMVDKGIELWPSSRADYRLGDAAEIVAQINRLYGQVYWVPEGGGGVLGAQGCRDWAASIQAHCPDFDAWVVSSGTGTTAAGFLSHIDLSHSNLSHGNAPDLHVFSALKGEPRQRDEIVAIARAVSSGEERNLSDRLFFYSDCHEGGYAKLNATVRRFLCDFARMNPAIPLDPIYTSKAMFTVSQLISAGHWPYKRTLFIHTGGMQGWRGYAKHFNPFF